MQRQRLMRTKRLRHIQPCQSGVWRGQGIGQGQTWQNVLAERASNVAYSNSTGKPISVSVSCYGPSGGAGAAVYAIVDGVTLGAQVDYIENPFGYHVANNFIVPAGSTYRVIGWQCNINTWVELR